MCRKLGIHKWPYKEMKPSLSLCRQGDADAAGLPGGARSPPASTPCRDYHDKDSSSRDAGRKGGSREGFGGSDLSPPSTGRRHAARGAGVAGGAAGPRREDGEWGSARGVAARGVISPKRWGVKVAGGPAVPPECHAHCWHRCARSPHNVLRLTVRATCVRVCAHTQPQKEAAHVHARMEKTHTNKKPVNALLSPHQQAKNKSQNTRTQDAHMLYTK